MEPSEAEPCKLLAISEPQNIDSVEQAPDQNTAEVQLEELMFSHDLPVEPIDETSTEEDPKPVNEEPLEAPIFVSEPEELEPTVEEPERLAAANEPMVEILLGEEEPTGAEPLS